MKHYDDFLTDCIEFAARAQQSVKKNSDRYPHILAQDVRQLIACAQRLHSLAVADCNYGLSDRQQAIKTATQRRIRGLCSINGWGPSFSGDPRGAITCIKFDTSKVGNTWDNRGFAVPVRNR